MLHRYLPLFKKAVCVTLLATTLHCIVCTMNYTSAGDSYHFRDILKMNLVDTGLFGLDLSPDPENSRNKTLLMMYQPSLTVPIAVFNGSPEGANVLNVYAETLLKVRTLNPHLLTYSLVPNVYTGQLKHTLELMENCCVERNTRQTILFHTIQLKHTTSKLVHVRNVIPN